MPSFNSDKSNLVLWQILMKINRKLSSYLDKWNTGFTKYKVK